MMKRKHNIWQIICLTGIPWGIIAFIAGIAYRQWYIHTHTRIKDLISVSSIALYSFMLMAFVFLRNSIHLQYGKKIGMFTWLATPKDVPADLSEEKRRAQNPKIDQAYLSDVPDQFPVAKQGDKYVQLDLGEYLSYLVFGSPGAGKSTILLTMIVYQLHFRKLNPGEKKPSMFVFDFKGGELYYKSCMPDQKNARLISLKGRDDWGWDIYYRLNSNSTDDEVIRELTLIAGVLIESTNEKNAFFTDSARVILIYVGLACFRWGFSFIKTIDYIMSTDVKVLIDNVLKKTETRPDMKKVRNALIEFAQQSDNEAFNNIKMNIKQKLNVFTVDDVRWALEYNPRKTSPFDLERGYSLFFYPGDVFVTETVMKIIAKQLEYHCKNRDFLKLRSDSELRQLIVVADECYTIGSLIDWTGWCSVARGFHTNVIMIWQSYSQIKELHNENYAESLMDDVAGVVVLAVNSIKNAQEFCNYAGEYFEEKRSYNEGGQNKGSYSRSYESKKILTPNDMLRLRREKKCLIMADGNFYIASTEPARIYKNQQLYYISNKCLTAHQNKIKDRSK